MGKTVFADGVSIWDHDKLSRLSPENRTLLTTQSLPHPITTAFKLSLQYDPTYLFVFSQHNIPLGYLKVGYKHLFLTDSFGTFKECDPLAVLDFYVQTNHQRQGSWYCSLQYLSCPLYDSLQ
ncbi:hypothetical protein GEMRC1_012425 [Eukaryota sp. GEM-RC1]